jgi:probable rRNA maturation factor
MLHLFGYDHIEPEDAAKMEPKQREILEAMNLSREKG